MGVIGKLLNTVLKHFYDEKDIAAGISQCVSLRQFSFKTDVLLN